MKHLYLRVEADIDIKIPNSLISKLPTKVALFTTAQYINQYETMAEQLESQGKEAVRIKTIHTRSPGQLLGCNIQSFKDYTDQEFEAILYVGDGLFHPQALMWKNEVPSYLYNPHTGEEFEAQEEHITRIIKRQAVALHAFKTARTVGVLIPHKPGGQLYLSWSLQLKKLYPDKNFINLVDYNVDFAGLENFNFCDVFVNCACPRIGFDDSGSLPKPVVNLEDVNPDFYKKQLRAR